MNKFLVLILPLAFLVGPVAVSADTATTTATTTQEIATTTVATTTVATTTVATTTVATTTGATTTIVIKTATSSLTEVASLLKQLQEIRARIAAILIQDLSSIQNNKARVILLQSILAQDAEVYPEGAVTGYFGDLTKKALVRYVNKSALKVSTSTDEILRGPARLLQEGAGNSGNIPAGLQTAPGIAKKLGIQEVASTSSTTASTSPRGFGAKIKGLFR